MIPKTGLQTVYICTGSVRGWCGIRHRTYEAAERHLEKDRRDCASLNWSGSLTRSYSDRSIECRPREEIDKYRQRRPSMYEEQPATQQHVYIDLREDRTMAVHGPEGIIVHLLDWRYAKAMPWDQGPVYEPPPELVQAATPLPDLTS